MTTKLVQSSFIKPYPQEALDGQLGLTCDDLSKVLKTKKENVIRKFKSLHLSPENNGYFNFTQHRVKVDVGRPRQQWVFCVDTCKLIIATYHNEIGYAYFKYLLKCERFVNEAAPKLLDRLKQAELEIEKLKAPRRVRKKSKMVDIIKRVETRTNMFGETETSVLIEEKPREILSEEEIMQYQIRHITSVAKGLNNKLDKLINEPYRKAKKQLQLIKLGNSSSGTTT